MAPRGRRPRRGHRRRAAERRRHPPPRRSARSGPHAPGRDEVPGDLRTRLHRARRGAAGLRGSRARALLAVPQRGRDGARGHRASLGVRRSARAGDLHRAGGAAGDGRLARGRLQRGRRLPPLRRRDHPRRRLQHAAGAEARAGALRPDHRPDGRVLDPAQSRRAARGVAPGGDESLSSWRAGPFYLNLPINTQPAETPVRLDALPSCRSSPRRFPPATPGSRRPPGSS